MNSLSDSRPDPEVLFREQQFAERLTQLSEHLSPVLHGTFQLRDLNGLRIRETAEALAIKPLWQSHGPS